MSNINKFQQKEGDIFSYNGEDYAIVKHVNAGCHYCDLRNKSDFSSKYCSQAVEYEGFPHCFRVDQKDVNLPTETTWFYFRKIEKEK